MLKDGDNTQTLALASRLKEVALQIPQKPRSGLNFIERSDRFDSYAYAVQSVLFSGKTRFQEVLIADTVNFGRVLVLDGVIQSSRYDEALYHEMLVQPALLFHSHPAAVLIIGGGEGASLREVLVHRQVEKATMVDIDGELVDLCKLHLDTWHRGAFKDRRSELVIGDGREFIESTSQHYDVIILDVVDMLNNGPAQALYTRQFYQKLKTRLNPGGILAVQAMEYSLSSGNHSALRRTLSVVFSHVHSYATVIPSFLSSWSFIVASDWLNPGDWSAEKIDEAMAEKIPGWTKHLDGQFIVSAFAHSKLAKQTLAASGGPIVEDGVRFQPGNYYEEVIDTCMKFPLAK